MKKRKYELELEKKRAREEIYNTYREIISDLRQSLGDEKFRILSEIFTYHYYVIPQIHSDKWSLGALEKHLERLNYFKRYVKERRIRW